MDISRLNQVISFKNPLTAQITAHKLDNVLSKINEIASFAVKKIPSGNGGSIYHPLSVYTAETLSVEDVTKEGCRGRHLPNIITAITHHKNVPVC